jgi:hypothetical protein
VAVADRNGREAIVDEEQKVCQHCGEPLVTEGGNGWTGPTHSGGPCEKQEVISVFGEVLTLQEYRALVRMARAQIEKELIESVITGRGREG